jgi:hypothetical protein
VQIAESRSDARLRMSAPGRSRPAALDQHPSKAAPAGSMRCFSPVASRWWLAHLSQVMRKSQKPHA